MDIVKPEVAAYYSDIIETINLPDAVYKGLKDEFLAVKQFKNGKYIIAIYKEILPDDGFVITAFLSNKINYLNNKQRVWERQK